MADEFDKKFDKCGGCGGKEWFFEDMAKELRRRGLVGKDWQFSLQVNEGVCGAKETKISLAVGDTLPAFAFMTDICKKCGLVSARRLVSTNVKKKPILVVPNMGDQRGGRSQPGSPFGM